MVIEAEHLSYNYADGRPALSDISLRVETGECLGVIGHSGAGKSTLLLHLNGLLLPRTGVMRIGGEPVSPANLLSIRRRVGQQWTGFWKEGAYRDSAEQAVATALNGETAQFEGHFTTLDGRSTWWR